MEPKANEIKLNELSEKIIGAAFEVSNILGVGFLEKVYENALDVELGLRGLQVQQQAPLKVYYKDELVGDYNRHQIKQNNRKLFRKISAFICVYLRLIFVSLSDIPQEIQFKLFPINKYNSIFYLKSDLNDRYFLL